MVLGFILYSVASPSHHSSSSAISRIPSTSLHPRPGCLPLAGQRLWIIQRYTRRGNNDGTIHIFLKYIRKELVMGQTPSSGFPIYHMEAHTVIKALEYISQKLCRKGIHVHLIVAGDALSCLLFKSRPTTYVILASFSLSLLLLLLLLPLSFHLHSLGHRY